MKNCEKFAFVLRNELENGKVTLSKKIKCFNIEEKELYLDQVLVELDFPILFVCKDKQNNYYMVMCIDACNLIYLVQNCSASAISNMILGKVTMRNFWLGATKCWKISTGNEPEQDVVLSVTVDSLDESELPDDEKYVIDDNFQKEYAISLNRNQSYMFQFLIECDYLEGNDGWE